MQILKKRFAHYEIYTRTLSLSKHSEKRKSSIQSLILQSHSMHCFVNNQRDGTDKIYLC